MKRASDVPPLVVSAGSRRVTAMAAPRMVSTSGPGLVRNTSPMPSKASEKRAPTSLAAFSHCARTHASTLGARVQVVVADVEVGPRRAGMTLVAVFGTEMIVACRLEGWKCAVPLSSGVGRQPVDDARELGDRIVGDARR